ncbi:MAG: PepSY domain-containing protein [Pseudomonadota bacterium]
MKTSNTTRTTFAALFATVVFAASAGVAQARDLGPDEALKLRDAGTIQSFEKLNAAALVKHPDATVEETELEEEYGRYIYQVELRDPKGVRWDLELDAVSADILKDHQDD